ncbi:hydantoinase/oxoprolinase family protein [Murinocardiopsis flavida]|uniref:hydantoinase/oxoprolinase family protein n=1 Tax=Murinocardiopsis flavida TaxID=645275 RepID=UPI001FE65F43|nr:hydantoinase/oxoprolinase family protein [Murinocardiopsis flavida]
MSGGTVDPGTPRPVQGDLRLGVDVGGTNTDAVVLDSSNAVIACTKQPTDDDVTGGIRAAIAAVLECLGERRHEVARVMLGTTHATNAIVGRRDLGRVAVIRLGAPAATGFPPLTGWPEELKAAVLAGSAVLPGGHMVDGMPISPLDPDAVREFLGGIDGPVDAVAVCGIFSTSFPEQETRVKEIAHAELGRDVPVSLSQDIGAIGLLERENATVLNAALYGIARKVTDALLTVVAEEGLTDASVYFAQNDGTLMALDFAVRYPVLTIGSGPANSIRGAAYLSGAENAIVVDVGGTTSDLGVVVGGFPRESTLPREIGGVRTNFRMPDILSIGVGGGTRVDPSTGRLGPDSVGHRLHTAALTFGGATATLTDAAVHTGRAGGASAEWSLTVERDMGRALESALVRAHEWLQDSVERLSHGKQDLPLVVVGGGGFLVPDDLPGAGTVLRPEHGDVANAVGAAMSLVGGRAQQIGTFEERDKAVAKASRAAVERAIEAGADPLKVAVIDIIESPVSYSTQHTIRVSAKAAGPLARLGSRTTTPAANP